MKSEWDFNFLKDTLLAIQHSFIPAMFYWFEVALLLWYKVMF